MLTVSPHTHCESFLTASTLSNLIERAKELGRTHFSCTDLGYLHSSFKAYNAAKKANLKPILGFEFYMKDPLCPIVSGSRADRCKYFTATAYATDQKAYQAICRIVSRTDFQTIEIREEKQNLFTWSTLEELSKYNIQIVLGGIHDIVGKAFLASDANIGLKVFEKLHSLFHNKLSIAIIAEPWTKKFSKVIEVRYVDETRDSILASDTVSTDRARKIKAQDLIDRPGHTEVVSKVVGGIYTEVGKGIESVKLHTGFLPLSCDVTLKINKFLVLLAKRYNIPILVSDYAYYAQKDDKVVQHVVLENKDKIYANQHMKSNEEILNYLEKIMGLSLTEADKIVSNNTEWAKKFDDFELKYEYRLADSGEDSLKKCLEIIKKNGRMKWNNPEYVTRLKEEIQVISKNGVKDFSAYFLPIYDVLTHYKENGRLTGPSRGSAGGSLFCFLMGITQLDPIQYGLSFPRFLSLDRIKNGDLPDVDVDLPDRELLVGKDKKSGYLYQRWGDRAAQISTRQMIRLKSAIKDVNRYINGVVEKDIEILTKGLEDAPQGIPDKDFVFGYEDTDGNHHPGLIEIDEKLQIYAQKRPKEWAIVQKSLGIVRSHGLHASAFCISDAPLQNVLPIRNGHITQYEAKQVEACGILKYDFLTVSNIKDIETCLNLINKKNNENPPVGYFSHQGKLEYIWNLPHDIKAYQSCWNGDTETLFQINTKTMAKTTSGIMPKSIEDGSVILALERPGPKDFIDPVTGKNMVEEYICRRNGESDPDLQELFDLISETYGIIVFQEQNLKISKELGGMAPADAEKLRRLFSKKLKKEAGEMKPVFMSTAIPKISEEKANKIWDMMETSSRYSFNLSHSVGYFLITYAGLFLRQNYLLEWWAAVLTNAEEKEITGKFWSRIKHFIAPPDVNVSTDKMEVDYDHNKIRSKIGVIHGMGNASIEPIVANRPYKDIQDFVNKDVCGPSLAHKLIHIGFFDSIFKPNMSLEEKLKSYQDAAEIKKYNDKKALAEKEGKKIRLTQPKSGSIPEQYVNLSPLKDAQMKKNVLPTMAIDLQSLGAKYSKIRDPESTKPKVLDLVWDKSVFLVDGPTIERLDALKLSEDDKDIYVAAMCYIIECKEFSYSKGTKRALKLVVDCGSGSISEKVLWPDYQSGDLIYPKDLKKGCLATIFFRKRAQKGGTMNITQICVEAT